jgi:arsenite-transporting ATPase
MKLPFIAKGDVEINKLSDELIISVGGFKKNMMLPRQVASSKSVKAKLEGKHLSIIFKGEDHGQKK